MLTRLLIRNFKLFDEVDIELGDRVVLVGPNNSGKTTALQALALWEIGMRRWLEKRGGGPVPEKRPGGTINRRDLLSVPVPAANLLWRDLHVREGRRTAAGKPDTKNVLIDIQVEGIDEGRHWSCGFEFDYANEESFYCRPQRSIEGERIPVSSPATNVRLAYLPPMSGLAAVEDRLDPGAINVRLGEGRTAEVLRNLCYQVMQGQNGEQAWQRLANRVEALFGVHLDPPEYLAERGQIVMSYRDRRGVRLDLSASGRGQQQTLLLLAHMAANPRTVLLLDEPDAHLEILRQRQTYRIVSEVAEETQSQILAASHSEVILNEAADRDVVVAFVGKPHRIDDRGSQVLKALKEIGFEHYYQAEELGWVLYLEGSTDLSILSTFAEILGHPAVNLLRRPFIHYVANQPRKAQEHFHALREAKKDLVGVAMYDRLDQSLPGDVYLQQRMWKRREIENYLCQRDTLLSYAESKGSNQQGPLSGKRWREVMEESIGEIESALTSLAKPSPWGADLKVSDEFLDPLFHKFYSKLELPNLMSKTDYHEIAWFVPKDSIAAEVLDFLDLVVRTAEQAVTGCT